MDYVIETDFQGSGFVAVPNYVAQSVAVSPEALGVLVYLASQPRGWLARWSTVCARFGIGKDKWQRIARELRAVGAMRSDEVRGAGGRLIGRRVLVRWPDAPSPEKTESRETPLSDRKPCFPAAGKPAKVSGQTRKSERAKPAPYKEERKTPARAQAAKPAQAGRSASPHAAASRPSAERAKGSQAAKVRETVQTAARAVTGAKSAGERARAESLRPETSGVPVDRIAQGWDKARSCASLGLQWRHPVSGEFHPATEFDRVSA